MNGTLNWNCRWAQAAWLLGCLALTNRSLPAAPPSVPTTSTDGRTIEGTYFYSKCMGRTSA